MRAFTLVFSFLLVTLFAVTAFGARSAITDNVTLEENKQGTKIMARKEVDFSFMTTDLRYPGHEAGMFGTVKEWFGGRAIDDDVKEEIVQGHACAHRGFRDETYYASSFFYWLPEFESTKRLQGGLTWRGGAYPKGMNLVVNAGYSGRCIQLSVCHNNARGERGAVSYTGFVQEKQLEAGCLKETFIYVVFIYERHIEKPCENKHIVKT